MNPKISMIINIVISVLGFLVSASAELIPVFGSATSSEIIAVSGLALGIVGAINAGLHAVSAPIMGPLLKYFQRG